MFDESLSDLSEKNSKSELIDDEDTPNRSSSADFIMGKRTNPT